MSKPDEPAATGAGPEVHRRQVIQGAAVIGGVGVLATALAACGTDEPAASVTSTSQPPADPAPGATTASGTIVAAADVPVAGGAVEIVDDRKVIVTQPEAGVYKGFSAVCTHEGCTVGGVEDGAIICRCHGSRFDTTTGDVLQGPAPTALAPIAVEKQGDNIVFA